MPNVVPATLALLVLCTLPATAAVAAPSPQSAQDVTDERSLDAPTPVATVSPAAAGDVRYARMLDGAESNTTNRLGLDGSISQAHVQPGSDLGTTVGSASDGVRIGFDLYRVEHRWTEYSQQERRDALDDSLDRVDERIEDLEAREQEAVASYAAGETSADELVRTLVRIDQESRALVESLETLDSLADEVSGYSVDSRSEVSLLESHQSEVRLGLDITFAGLADERASNAVLVQATETGAVVSLIDGETYHREAMRFDNRDTSAPDSFSSDSDVIDRRDELYPWASGDGYDGSATYLDRSERQLYSTGLTTVHGELQAYIDGGTGNVFSETQELRILDLPSTPADRIWENESLELAVNRTPANGPIEVTATDAETNESIDADVSIDDTHLGETGADGSLWVLPPSGAYNLSAETSDRTVNATISP